MSDKLRTSCGYLRALWETTAVKLRDKHQVEWRNRRVGGVRESGDKRAPKHLENLFSENSILVGMHSSGLMGKHLNLPRFITRKILKKMPFF